MKKIISQDLLNVAVLILSLKIAFIVAAIFAYNLLPIGKSFYSVNFIYPPNDPFSVFSIFKTWDGQHYLFLADRGYSSSGISSTFYPLFPLLISLFNSLFNNILFSGLFVSNVLSFLGGVIFYMFVKKLFNKKTAFLSLIILLSFPTAFYFNVVYSESLFFFLSVAFFYFLYKKKLFTASIFAFFLPMTRGVGILILVPFIIFMITNFKNYKKISIPTFNKPINIYFAKELFFLLSPLFGILIYFIFMKASTGDLFSAFESQEAFVGVYSLNSVFNPKQFMDLLFFEKVSLHGFSNSTLYRISFMLYLISLPLVYKKTDKTLFSFVLVMGLTPLLGSFIGYLRYLLVIFPIFIALSRFFDTKKGRYLLYPYISLSISLMVLFSIMHVLNYWVS